MNFYRDKTILITGASSGIGEAIAREVASASPILILAARRMNELERVADICLELGAADVFCFPMDVTNSDQIAQLVKEIESRKWKIDVFFNNAGISQRSEVLDAKEEVERQIMEVNYFAPVNLSKAFYPLFSEDARMVILSSLSGLFGFPLRTTYSASKHALKGFFQSWQVENPFPAISLVYPGRINSNISFNALHGDGEKHAVLDKAQEEGMPADKCARIILSGVAKKKKQILVGQKELILYWFYRFIPAIYYKIASNIKANG